MLFKYFYLSVIKKNIILAFYISPYSLLLKLRNNAFSYQILIRELRVSLKYSMEYIQLCAKLTNLKNWPKDSHNQSPCASESSLQRIYFSILFSQLFKHNELISKFLFYLMYFFWFINHHMRYFLSRVCT